MKIMRKPLAAALFLGLMLGTAFLAVGQSVFPVRLGNDAPPAPITPGANAGVVASTLQLTPQDYSPFTCLPDKFGTLYVQRDSNDVLSTWDQVLCMCVPNEDDPSSGYWKWVGPTVNDCAQYALP